MIYTANWGIIWYLPPVKGTRKLHWFYKWHHLPQRPLTTAWGASSWDLWPVRSDFPKIAVEMRPPFFFGSGQNGIQTTRKKKIWYGYKTTSIYFFLIHSLFFAWIAFSDHKEGDILLKTTTFTSSISWDNWQDAISSTGCRVALKFG